MANPNMGAAIVAAWEAYREDDDKRVKQRVTELHRWERSRNGRWVDTGYMRCPSRSNRWLFNVVTSKWDETVTVTSL